jgi:CdiI N-terminal domain
MFAIELQSSSGAGDGNDDGAEAFGTITIDDFSETFVVPLGFWGESDYRRSWRRAFEVLEADPRAVSCLMTSMTDPRNSNFLVCWPMYRSGEDVFVQNALIFLDETGEGFDPESPWGLVSPRQPIDEDGNKVSEWITSMDSVKEFFR